MALIVQKYGGTSVGTTDCRIKLIAEKIKKSCSSGDKLVVVVSAMSGETNRLVSLSDAINKNPSPRDHGCFTLHW